MKHLAPVRQCSEVGEKGLKAVHRQAIRRGAMGLFGDGRGRALRLSGAAGSQGLGGRLVGIVVEHRGVRLRLCRKARRCTGEGFVVCYARGLDLIAFPCGALVQRRRLPRL
jgi:hypothetical protein